MANLWELTERLKWLEDQLDAEDEDGCDYSESTASKLASYLADTEQERDEKLDGYAWIVKKLEAELAACEAQVYEWQVKRDARKKRIAWMKLALQGHMEMLGEKKLKTTHFAFSLCANGGSVPLDIDEELVPERYFDPQPPKLNRDRLRDEWMAAADIPGVVERPRGKHVRIK